MREPSVNPIEMRAQIWKAQNEQNDGLKARIESHEIEISDIKWALKTKIDECSEMQIRQTWLRRSWPLLREMPTEWLTYREKWTD